MPMPWTKMPWTMHLTLAMICYNSLFHRLDSIDIYVQHRKWNSMAVEWSMRLFSHKEIKIVSSADDCWLVFCVYRPISICYKHFTIILLLIVKLDFLWPARFRLTIYVEPRALSMTSKFHFLVQYFTPININMQYKFYRLDNA